MHTKSEMCILVRSWVPNFMVVLVTCINCILVRQGCYALYLLFPAIKFLVLRVRHENLFRATFINSYFQKSLALWSFLSTNRHTGWPNFLIIDLDQRDSCYSG